MVSGSSSGESVDEDLSKESSWVARLETTLAKLKQKVQSSRSTVVVEKMESNRAKLLEYSGRLSDWSKRWVDKGRHESLSKHQRVVIPSEGAEGKEDGFSAAVPVIFSTNPSKQTIRAVKLTPQQNVPPYTTWIYLDRNQRMTEDQSVQGRRRIYYDPIGNETLIASDSEEEDIEEEEAKHEFSKAEDYVIWMTVQECGVDERVFEQIARSFDVNRDDVQARYETIANDVDKRTRCEAHGKGIHTRVIISPSGRRKVTRDQGRFSFRETPSVLEAESSQKHGRSGQQGKTNEKEENVEAKDLVAAMDSFDNLFCRRCLVFDCRLHGCSQPLVHPSERQLPVNTSDVEKLEPCGRYCYMLVEKPPTAQAQTSVSSGLASSPSNVGETSSTIEGAEKARVLKRQKIREGETCWSPDIQIQCQTETLFSAEESASKGQIEVTGCGSQELIDTLVVETGKGSMVNDPADAFYSPKRAAKVVVTVNSAKKLARSLSRKGAEEWGLGQSPSPQRQKSPNAGIKTHGKSDLVVEVEAGHVSTQPGKSTGKTTEVAVDLQQVRDQAFPSEDDTVYIYEKKSSQKKQSRVSLVRKGEEVIVTNRQPQLLHTKVKSMESSQRGGDALKGDTDSEDEIIGKTLLEKRTGTSGASELQYPMLLIDPKRKGEERLKEEKSRETFISAKKLARRSRKSAETIVDSVEAGKIRSQATLSAQSLQDFKPQKEERTRNTAAKKLARSSRNSIAQRFSEHQLLQMEMNPDHSKRGVDDMDLLTDGSTATCAVRSRSLDSAAPGHISDQVRDASYRGDEATVLEGNKLLGKRSRPAVEGDSKKDVGLVQDLVRVQRFSVIDPTEELMDGKGATEVSSIDKWTALEKGLYEKGLQVFGRSSCLIAKTMLRGCRTCAEVAAYITAQEKAAMRGVEAGLHQFADSLACVTNWDTEIKRARAKFFGKKKGSRRLKFTLKSAGQSAIRKRMNNGKDTVCRQFTPCGCLFSCGKQCPCQLNGTCCEKYCGCAKGCKNRFRGCHCAKSQCCSRQCPCFAAGRECDPDVCRNCWIGCGDGNLVCPPQREEKEHYTCHNMKLLLKQQQRVLLSRSDVAGWGAFLKSTVNKHDYLGEYTGELISHREADKRGKIYDRENSSFLFNLNDQYVLDACRKGDKLKFANHSPNPNCYAKVIMVAGGHRVGIFAKERIMAGEELFYDYRYEADRAPSWAKKGDDGGNGKKDDSGTSSGRGTKQAS